MKIRYLSICSGIEAATVAWAPLGWEAVAFAEIDRFPSALLTYHYPDIPNLGDFTLIPYRGKPAKDGPRYKALGNSFAVPVIEWIGRRMQAATQRGEDRHEV